MIRPVAILLAGALAFAGALAVRAQPTATVDAATVVADGMPRNLSAFGFFADGPGQVPAMGVVPYRLNTPLYSDGAEKLRFIYVPPGQQAKAGGEGLLDLPGLLDQVAALSAAQPAAQGAGGGGDVATGQGITGEGMHAGNRVTEAEHQGFPQANHQALAIGQCGQALQGCCRLGAGQGVKQQVAGELRDGGEDARLDVVHRSSLQVW